MHGGGQDDGAVGEEQLLAISYREKQRKPHIKQRD
jgi:hypothetical protein